MKFKYNFLENRLWKSEREYSSEISENNYFHTPQGTYGTDGFHLGEKESVLFGYAVARIIKQIPFEAKNCSPK